jgi:monofunctional biosynthetic peptidoglycan transglycosylase
MKKKRKWTYKLFVKLPLLFVTLSFALVLLLRYIPVYYTPLMLKRSIENRKVESFKTQHTWVSLDQISPQLAKAVVMTEDQKFYTHNGFDWEEIKKMREDHLNKGTKLRGCSTISQQTAKNVFSFGTRTGARKVWEAYWTVLIELLWSKDRIMEVYLNIIDFKCNASKLTRRQALSIAICLPNPLRSNPTKLTTYQRNRLNSLLEQMQ